MPKEEIFSETGIQFMSINTLYQLLDDARRRPEIMTLAAQFLTIGDYFNYLLGGVARIEESLASTTQLYNPRTRGWSKPLLQSVGIAGKFVSTDRTIRHGARTAAG